MRMETLSEFRTQKIEAREAIHEHAVATLKALHPLALHQFGSGGRGEGDEFSDIDLFATLPDSELASKVEYRLETYAQVAPLLVRLYQTKANPAGWYHDLILYDTPGGIVHVDYYLTPRSKVVLPPNAKLLLGEDNLPMGEWSLPPEKDSAGHDLYDGILAMSYIAVKGVVRKWDPGFFEWLTTLYDSYVRDVNQNLAPLPKQYDFAFIEAILRSTKEEGNKKQHLANQKITAYLEKVSALYSV